MQFMEVAREKALQTKVLMAGYEQSEIGGSCHKCRKSGHKARDCPDIKANAAYVSTYNKAGNRDTKEKIKEDKKWFKEQCGKCPL